MADIGDTSIEKEMQASYIDYAMSVIIGRALPDARDGLKPAQRRILYAMHKLNNHHNQPTKKSARIVGDVIGKYHPHGDMAVYEALVRMAQTFTINYPLVEGQGNMGSIDGDPPAAQRYTEVRLRALAEEMLSDIEKNSVEFVPNFDNTEEEPIVLPSKIPNLIMNGASGIAVGVSTNILPHNLREVCDAVIAYVEKPEITNEEMAGIVKGPDFPTGGIVFYNDSLLKSYMSGRGSVVIRGRAAVEEGKPKKIVITEIPYYVNKATLVEKIANLSKEKKLQGLSDLRDESGKEGIRIVIELKGDANPEQILNMLYAHTQLQVSMPVINVAVMGNNLLTLTLRDMIKVFVDYRVQIIKKRTRFDLEVASDRMHIVEGLNVAVKDIDRTVGIIKGSKDPRTASEALIREYGISDKQSNAVLEMKLSRLTSINVEELAKEREELKAKILEFNRILSDESAVYEVIKQETGQIKEKYGIDRRTEIDYGTLFKNVIDEDLITDKESIVILTSRGYIKRIPAAEYRTQGRGGRGVISIELKDNDFVEQIISCMSKDYLLLISNTGKAFWLKAYQIAESGRYSGATAAVNMLKLQEGEKITNIINTRSFKESFLVFITRRGRVKRVNAERFSKPRSSGIRAIPIPEGDELVEVCISKGNSELLIATASGKALRFGEEDIRATGRQAAGVRGIRLREGDEVATILAAGKESVIISITKRGFGKVTEIQRYRLQRRGGKGVINMKLKEGDKVIKSVDGTGHENLMLINSKGISIEIPISSIRTTGRGASGVRLMKLDAGTEIVDAKGT